LIGKPEEKRQDHFRDVCVDERIILKWIFGK